MAKKKPILLWRTDRGLGGKQPDDFQTMPAAVSERLIETLVNEGRTVLILTWDTGAENVTVERHIPDEDSS